MTQITTPPNGSKTGYNSAVSTTAFTTISNAVVVEPSISGTQAKVSSSSTSDIGNGSGIQKVRIRYFDTNWNLNDEIVTMNGTTAVNTVATNILRIESFESFQIGTTLGGAAGTIKLQTLTNQLLAQIDIGGNQFLRSQHTTTPGKKSTITDIIISSQTSGGVSFVVYKEVDNTSNGGNIVLITDLSFTIVGGVMQIALFTPVVCDATLSTQGLRIGVSAYGLSTTQAALVSFHYNES